MKFFQISINYRARNYDLKKFASPFGKPASVFGFPRQFLGFLSEHTSLRLSVGMTIPGFPVGLDGKHWN